MVTCTGLIGIHEGADVRMENDVMAILPNFLPSMGYRHLHWRKMSAHESRKMARDTFPGLSLALMKKALPRRTEKCLPFENR